MGWFRTRASAVVGLTFLLGVTSSCGGSKPTPMTPTEGAGGSNDKGPAEVGKAAPDLSVKTVNGKGEITRDSLAGKVAIVDFWATWCEPCKKSFPKLQELYTKYKGQLEIVAISEDEENQGLKDFADSHGNAKFPIVFDEGKSIAGKWHPDKMPSTFIVDKSGVVKFVHLGYHDGEEADIEREIKGLL